MLSLLLLLPSLIHAATVTITSAPQPTAASPSFTNSATFQVDVLAATNFYRSEHNASAVVWNQSLATYAANWSRGCDFKHSGGPSGENLAAGYANASASIDAWGLEREKYSWSSPGFSESTGHFTQLVWGNTTSMGCGVTDCNGENDTPGYYVVCEYYPAGNIVGDKNEYFVWNVKKQVKGKKTDTVESGVTSAAVINRERREGLWGALVLGAAVLMGIGVGF